MLSMLDIAETAEDVDVPGWHLHPLSGDLDGYWAIALSANWRIVFRFDGTDVADVDFVDYH